MLEMKVVFREFYFYGCGLEYGFLVAFLYGLVGKCLILVLQFESSSFQGFIKYIFLSLLFFVEIM